MLVVHDVVAGLQVLEEAGALPLARAGLAVGGITSIGAASATVFGVAPPGVWHAVMANPAAWSVPLALLVTVVVSLATPGRVPATTAATMVRLHLPEGAFPGRSRIG